MSKNCLGSLDAPQQSSSFDENAEEVFTEAEKSELKYDALEYLADFISKKLNLNEPCNTSYFTWTDQLSEG